MSWRQQKRTAKRCLLFRLNFKPTLRLKLGKNSPPASFPPTCSIASEASNYRYIFTFHHNNYRTTLVPSRFSCGRRGTETLTSNKWTRIKDSTLLTFITSSCVRPFWVIPARSSFWCLGPTNLRSQRNNKGPNANESVRIQSNYIAKSPSQIHQNAFVAR